MHVYNQNGLNSLSNYTASLSKDSVISTLTIQQKKIIAIASCAIGLFAICILAFKTKIWPAYAKVTKKGKALAQSIVEAEAKLIKEAALAEAEKIKTDAKTQAEAEAKKIKADAQSIKDQAEALAKPVKINTNGDADSIKAQAVAEANKIKSLAKLEADKIKADAKANSDAEAKMIKTEIQAEAKAIKEKAVAEADKIKDSANAEYQTTIDKANAYAKSIMDKANAEAKKIKDDAVAEAEALKLKAKIDAAKTTLSQTKTGQDVETASEVEVDPSQAIHQYAIDIINAADYPDATKAIQDVKVLCQNNEFNIPQNVADIEKNLEEELVKKNKNYQTFLAVQKDGTIVGALIGEANLKDFYITNLALKTDNPSTENVELRLILQAMEKTKSLGKETLKYDFQVNDDKFLEEKYQKKVDFFNSFQKAKLSVHAMASWVKPKKMTIRILIEDTLDTAIALKILG